MLGFHDFLRNSCVHAWFTSVTQELIKNSQHSSWFSSCLQMFRPVKSIIGANLSFIEVCLLADAWLQMVIELESKI